MEMIDQIFCLLNSFLHDARRWIFLFSYAIYVSGWYCYFRYYWFCEAEVERHMSKVAVMWLVRVLMIVYSPLLLSQTLGFLSHFPAFAAYDFEEPKLLKGKFPPLIFRVVSRGDDVAVLQRGVEFHTVVLKQLGVEDWLYQLVIEKPNELSGEQVETIVVPKHYRTPKNTLYKARNLHYALKHPTVKFNQLLSTNGHLYLVHLDEETLVTAEAMRNCLELSRANKFRCGHGMITYGWHKIPSLLATFTDSWRMSLDAGMIYSTFRLQRRCRLIKGGFFMLRSDLESEIGWDFGPNVIQEDFHLSRLIDDIEEPVEYIDGVVMEESPIDIWGLIRQRSRWFVGAFQDVTDSDDKFNWAILTSSFLVFWLTAPLLIFVFLFGVFRAPLDVFYPIFDDVVVVLVASLPFQYFYGVQLNFRLPNAQRLALTLASLTFIPVVLGMILESCGVFHGIHTWINMHPSSGPKFSHTQKAVVKRTASNKLR